MSESGLRGCGKKDAPTAECFSYFTDDFFLSIVGDLDADHVCRLAFLLRLWKLICLAH